MNIMQKTVSDNTFLNSSAPVKKLVIGNAFKFSPQSSNNSTPYKHGGQYSQQVGQLEILRAFEPKSSSLKTRRLSSDANQQASGQAYFNGQSGGMYDNSPYNTGFDKMYRNQKSDWRSNESSAASSSGDQEQQEFHQIGDECHDPLEGGEAGSSVLGQALEYCEATRGAKKKQFKNAEERFQFKQQYEAKKKTELCRNFEMYGHCKFGNDCSYAHGSQQLQKKTHLPSNFMTKLCTQFHRDGLCMYGERCQFLHSVYDLKTDLTYSQALREGARLTQQRNSQISGESFAECLWANLKTGDGCGAPKGPRLPCFENIYNKDNKENLRKLEEEDAAERFQCENQNVQPNSCSPTAPQNSMNRNPLKSQSYTQGSLSNRRQTKQQELQNIMSFTQSNRMRFDKPLTIQRPFVPPTFQPQPIKSN